MSSLVFGLFRAQLSGSSTKREEDYLRLSCKSAILVSHFAGTCCYGFRKTGGSDDLHFGPPTQDPRLNFESRIEAHRQAGATTLSTAQLGSQPDFFEHLNAIAP